MKKSFSFFFIQLFFFASYAQTSEDTTTADILLPDIRIKAFEHSRKLKEVPAAVLYLSRTMLERFNPGSIVAAVNTMPGVKMEERSPGSYRFNIRGSSMRSPFGVRNVKVYFNDIPITDPGGHTYLNALGSYNFHSMEIIKGPASSLYGAGTGGALLIQNMPANEQAGSVNEFSAGSFNQQTIYTSFSTASQKFSSRTGYQHQQSDGYRDHSALRRNIISWTGNLMMNENGNLKTSFLYSDLFYETPGALTKPEYSANPKASRPASPPFPSAAQANASIRQKSFVAGASWFQKITSWLHNKTVAYGMFTELKNPAIRNYGKNSEPHVGGRTVFTLNKNFYSAAFNFNVGAEWQEGFATANVHKNVNGNADSLISTDDINTKQRFVFSQASLDIKKWTLTAGFSVNSMKLKFQRFVPSSLGVQKRNYNNQLSPRIAVMRKIEIGNSDVHFYSALSKGFSPASTTEILPTGSNVNTSLGAEEGTNYEVGIKSTIGNKLYIDINTFIFSLKNTIVQRRDAGGGDYYINAGKTKQQGIETYISYPVALAKEHQSLLWLSHTWHRFLYKEFKQVNNDFSGKQMPATAPHILACGFDFYLKNGWLGNINYYFSDKIPLNDANSEFADAYHLAGAKIGYQKWLKEKWRCRIIAGAENLLDQKYSLGNDVNAFGGRYYNAAPRRNFYLSLMIQWISKKSSL